MTTELETAKQEYKTADDKTKALLEKIFGKENLVSSNLWMELWEKFCKENNLTLNLPYPEPKDGDEEYIDANFMMMHIVRKKRRKKPDWNNTNESKYTPYFDMRKSSGFGFSGSDTNCDGTGTGVASRLCIPNDRDLAVQIQNEYEPIYEKLMKE